MTRSPALMPDAITTSAPICRAILTGCTFTLLFSSIEIDEAAVLPRLHRRFGHHDGFRFDRQNDAHVNELSGPDHLVLRSVRAS